MKSNSRNRSIQEERISSVVDDRTNIMFIPGSTPTNINLPITTMNNNLHQQQFFDNLKDHRSNKLLSPMSRKTSATPNFLLDPEILRELNARYLHDINTTRNPPGTNSNFDSNGLPAAALLLPPFLRAEHYHQHTHTHEHNLNILTPTNNSSLNGNAFLDKLSKSDNSLSPFLRTTPANNFSLPPPPPIFPPFNLINNPPSNSTSSSTNTRTKETTSPSAKKSNKWCAAHVRISWMIYHQQQRSKDKSSIDNKKDDEQQSLSNNKLSDLVPNTKPILPPPMSTNNELSLPLPSTFQSPLLPPAAFNYRSPFDFGNVNNGPFGRLAPSSNTAFGGLGSLFPPPPPPPPSTSIDRKPDLNGSVATAAALGLDWSRFHRGIVGPSPLIPSLNSHSTNNDNLTKKPDEINHNSNHNEKKRSSSVLTNVDDDRRNGHHHHHAMHPPSSHGTNSTNYSSNRSRSRSPHRSIHQHNSSSSLLNKTSSSSCSSPPSHSSSSRKRLSPHMKSDNNSKNSSHPPSPLIPLPPTFGAFDPLTLSIIERQRLSAAYASLIANASQTNNFYPANIDPTTIYRPNGTSNVFTNVDSSAMTAALMQREHFLNSLRQQQEFIERERAAVASMNKNISKSSISNQQKIEQITSPKNSIDDSIKPSPKPAISPSSHSSTSNSSSSSKKVKHVEREQDSLSPSATVPSTKENFEITPKEESNIQSAVTS